MLVNTRVITSICLICHLLKALDQRVRSYTYVHIKTIVLLLLVFLFSDLSWEKPTGCNIVLRLTDERIVQLRLRLFKDS